MINEMSTLTIIGAGPGDPDLITLKAINALEKANVVLFDSLVNEYLLKYASNSLKIFVGKRKGFKPFTQEAINKKIVDLSKTHTNIVRLKGGDPFVFGRGFEEIEFAKKHGLNTCYIPGISSAVGAVGCAGIPVTHRDLSRGFWVLTATCSNGEISEEIYTAAKSNSTTVILMGLSKLKEITEIYKNAGKSELPVAVIQNGSLKNQRVVIGKVIDIYENAICEGIGSPAILVFGNVVQLAELPPNIDYKMNAIFSEFHSFDTNFTSII
jgi:uroporphyrin-III C-methyltransferase